MREPHRLDLHISSTNKHTQLYDSANHRHIAIKQFLPIFPLVIFVHITVNYMWMKRKFSPLYAKTFQFDNSQFLNSKQKIDVSEIIKIFGNVNSTLTLFHV